MKNCVSASLPNGKKRLIDSDSRPIDAFNRFACFLEVNNYSASTQNTYLQFVANFIDYLIEAGVYGKDALPTQSQLSQVIDKYIQVLKFAETSKDKFVSNISKSLERKPLASTEGPVAAINLFLEYAAQIAKDERNYSLVMGGNADLGINEIFLSLKKTEKISDSEFFRLQQNSILGSNLRVIKQRNRTSYLRSKKSTVLHVDECKNFPLEDIEDFLFSVKNPRDKAFWALQAAGGLRSSEALALRWDQIDFNKMQVRIEDPNNLRRSFEDLGETSFRWKGRNTSVIFLLPFLKEIFFDALSEWRKISPLTPHNFVFTKVIKDGYGQPLINTKNDTLNGAFKRAQRKILKSKSPFTLHSLRHFYGYFLANYFPDFESNSIGLPLREIQVMMGHVRLESTKKYARIDKKRLIEKLEIKDRLIRGETPISLKHQAASWYLKKAEDLGLKITQPLLASA